MAPVVTPKKGRGSHSGASPLTVSTEIAEAAASPLPKTSALMCNLTNKAKSTPWNREYRRNNKKKKSAKLIQFTNSCWNLLVIVSIRVFIKLCYSLKTWHMMELPGLNIPDTFFPSRQGRKKSSSKLHSWFSRFSYPQAYEMLIQKEHTITLC